MYNQITSKRPSSNMLKSAHKKQMLKIARKLGKHPEIGTFVEQSSNAVPTHLLH